MWPLVKEWGQSGRVADARRWVDDADIDRRYLDQREKSMRLLLIAVALLSSAAWAAERSSSIRAKTEQAFSAAVAVGDAEQDCGHAIGKQRALALVRYCRWVSSATRPPCNTVNECALIVKHIRGMCGAPNATVLGQTCERFGESSWQAVNRMPAH